MSKNLYDKNLKNWMLSEYNNGKGNLRYYLNKKSHNIGDIAYVYSNKDDKITELKITQIIKRSDNPDNYDDFSENILLEKEKEYNADFSAEFIVDHDCYLVWFKTINNYEFECFIDKSYQNHTYIDEWGCAILWVNNAEGVEYNFCIDSGCNSCAIYKMYYDKEKDMTDTDYSTFEHYEINFNDKNWKFKLEQAMLKAAKQFFNY